MVLWMCWNGIFAFFIPGVTNKNFQLVKSVFRFHVEMFIFLVNWLAKDKHSTKKIEIWIQFSPIKILRNAGTKVFKSKNSFQNNNQKSVLYDLKKYFFTSSASTCSPSTRPCSSSFASLPSSAPLGFFFFINLHIVNNTDNVNKQLFCPWQNVNKQVILPVNAPTNSCKDSNKDDGNNGDDHPWFHASFIDHKINSFFFFFFDCMTNIFDFVYNNVASLKLWWFFSLQMEVKYEMINNDESTSIGVFFKMASNYWENFKP